MASSSSLLYQTKYDVFISFRATDVRRGFISHLTKELQRKLIYVYVDDERLERVKEISSALVKAIEASMISLVIFSKYYATSRWCLEELVKIMECNKVNNQIVIPVFYKVDPTDVRHQKGTYGDAFAEHEQKYDMGKLQSWKCALNKAANLSGYHFASIFQDDSELISEIVKYVLNKLEDDFTLDGSPQLVGLEEKCAHVESLLEFESREVRIIGIWGMGGKGKTTLARAICDKFSSHFQSCCFMENVREESQRIKGLSYLLHKLYCQLLEDNNLNTSDVLAKRSIKRRLSQKKVLIVLDDVDTVEQLEYLVGEQVYSGLGSRVIITSRNRRVFKGVHAIYEIGELNSKESLELFNLYAFNERHPKRGYEELSKSVVLYGKGIPVALKVLGLRLRLKNKEAWEDALRMLQEWPYTEVHHVLRVSYDGLDELEKNLFLDIAFFFREHPKADVIEILDGCDFYATIRIEKLLDKALITISDDSKINMHDLIQEMGELVVYEESPTYPGGRSRLNNLDDLYYVLRENEGTDAVEGIILDLSQIRDVCLRRDTFQKMPNLRILMFYLTSLNKRSNVKLPFGLVSLPGNLRYFRWDGYPLMSLPSIFCAEKLVELHMEASHVKFLWNGVQDLFNLKKVYLSESKLLIELPDFSRARKLEMVYLSYCECLTSVHSSMFYLPMLASLNLKGCKELRRLQSEIHLKPLTDLNFVDCFNLEDFSFSSKKVVSLDHLSSKVIEILNY